MHRLQNEQGYTLLLTLVFTVTIVLLFSTVSLSALMQQKQVKQTDTSFETTTLAEMGIEYYRGKIIHLSKEEGILLRNELNENVQKIPSQQLNEQNIRNNHFVALLNNIKSLQTSNSPVIVHKENKVIRAFSLYKTSGDIATRTIEIVVQGQYLNNTSEITAKFTIPDNLVVLTSASDIGNANQAHVVAVPTKPTAMCFGMSVSPCFTTTPPDVKSIGNITMWIEKGVITFGNDTGQSQNFNSFLYLMGETTFNYINGSNLNLYTSHNLTFAKHVSLDRAKIETAGIVTFDFNSSGNNDKTSFSNSTILANGIELNTSNKNYDVTFTNSSKLCLRDKKKALNLDRITINSEPGKQSYMYILDTTIPVQVSPYPFIQYVSTSVFNSKCGEINSKHYITNSLNLNEFTKEITYH